MNHLPHRGAYSLLLPFLLSQAACGGACSGNKSSDPPPAPPSSSASEQGKAEGVSKASAPECPEGMVRIPAGSFVMGHADDGDDRSTPHRVTLTQPYCIDRLEVTVEQYRECMQAGKCGEVRSSGWSNSPNRPPKEGEVNYPATGVDWFSAENYCIQQGKRLPTEAEWEYAARGSDGRLYPWGNQEPNETLAASTYEATVGTHPAGASPFGVQDMAGSASEWVADWHGPYPEGPVTDPTGPTYSGGESWSLPGVTSDKVHRGRTHDGHPEPATVGKWGRDPWEAAHGDQGFRCALFVGSPARRAKNTSSADVRAFAARLFGEVHSARRFTGAPATDAFARICHSIPSCSQGCGASLALVAGVPPRPGDQTCAELRGASLTDLQRWLLTRFSGYLERAPSAVSARELEVLSCDAYLADLAADGTPCLRLSAPSLPEAMRIYAENDPETGSDPYSALCAAYPICGRNCQQAFSIGFSADEAFLDLADNCDEIAQLTRGLDTEATIKRYRAWTRQRFASFVRRVLDSIDPNSANAHAIRCRGFQYGIIKKPEPDCEEVLKPVVEERPDWLD